MPLTNDYPQLDDYRRMLRAAQRSYDLGAYADSYIKAKDVVEAMTGKRWAHVRIEDSAPVFAAAVKLRANSRGALRAWLANTGATMAGGGR